MATAEVGTPRTLVLSTMPSPPPVQPSAVVGRKSGKESMSTEAAVVDAVQAGSAAAEKEALEPSRKRLFLALSEVEDEEEVPPMTGTAADVEAVAAKAPDVEVAIAEVAAGEAVVAEATAGEATVQNHRWWPRLSPHQ
ncbi:hypothetical protein Pyn_26599 [Prunus yedoensis var. nudiflora]|uniref:Uncharacterized protein n=1 Tax=Prunus yedoensis var. nudiflora TaxID=2094558 RepID=A0A314Z8Y3_PRUYE|nr:hypothetical protein Pyn_26599 [Prunus yedoensis var. nudiflora]